MNDAIEIASLLPYLKTDGTRFHVKLSVGTQNDVFPQKTSFPFLVLFESRPLARIIEAKILTDAGTQVEPVFLLIQKDEYPLTVDELRPLDNRVIDRYWQHTFTFYSNEKSNVPLFILKDQVGKNGALLPFQPLLYCWLKQAYFHPLCPDCGELLQQCYNDTMLCECGLLPYSESLKRYLFCAACNVSRQKPDFYVSSLAANDPEFLKDRFELIQNIGQLIGNEKFSDRLPCIDCNRNKECYGSGGLAASRIVSLSFYPFYMLMFNADSINAADFLSLISGASYHELEKRLREIQLPGRRNRLKFLKDNDEIKTTFFPPSKDRYFLEVLYLKLTFLGELLKVILPRIDAFHYPELGLSLDRIWIKVSDQSTLLPCYWNFKIELLDVIGAGSESLLSPQVSQAYGRHLFGTIWFYTLLVNSKQNASQVFQMIRKLVEEVTAQNSATFENYLENSFPPAFTPENIFWSPNIMSVKEDWHKFWKVSLCLGFHFLDGRILDLKKWSKKEFEKELEKLRQQIRDNLFPAESFVSKEEHPPEDNAIYNILTKIMQDWQEGVETPSDEFEASIISTETVDTIQNGTAWDFQEDTDKVKTIILSPDGEIPEKSADIKQKKDIGETVIISSDVSEKETAHPTEPENDLDKTLILTHERSKTTEMADSFDHGNDEMDETVILSPDDIGQQLPSSPPYEADDVSETVIISPEQSDTVYPEVSSGPPMEGVGSEDTVKGYGVPDEMKTVENRRTKTSDPDESIDETIIIRPEKAKDNH